MNEAYPPHPAVPSLLEDGRRFGAAGDLAGLQATVRAGFSATPQAPSRWMVVDCCLNAVPDNPALYDLAADLFLQDQQFAYAARVAVRARHLMPSIHLPDWPALKACAWC